MMRLAEELIGGYMESKQIILQDKTVTTLPTTSVHHELVRMEAKHAMACAGCLKDGKKSKGGRGKRERRTVYGCKVCRQHFCLDRIKNKRVLITKLQKLQIVLRN